MRLLQMIVQRKVLIILLTAFIMLIGSYTLFNLEKELTPVVDLDAATIEVTASHLNTEDMENKVTNPLEQKIQEIDGIKEISSTTSVGHHSMQLMFENDQDHDLFQEVESTTSLVLSDIPDIEQIDVNQAGSDTAFEFILDISEGDMEQTTTFAKDVVQPRLEDLPEVREVMFTGLAEQQVDLHFNKEKIAEKGLSINEVITHIQQINQDENLGEVTAEENNPMLRWDTTFDDLEELKSLRIPTDHGPIQLNELATIKVNSVTSSSNTWKNGTQDVIMVQVGKNAGVSQNDMTEAVRDEIQKIQEEDLVDDFTINEVVAHADFVNDSINDVTMNILIGGIIAIIVLLLFLRNLRATFIIGLSIPTSILLTFIAMGLLDYSMNLLTLIGLGLGIGMMVDSSIVILESIYHKKEQGLRNLDAVLEGTKEVSTAIIASVLTTIVVFLPIGLIGGDSGKFMMILAVVVAITLISSVVISFTLIPTFTKDFMKISKQKDQYKESIVLSFYKKVVAWCIEKKSRSLLVIITFLLVFSFSFFLIPKIPMNIMPDMFNRYTEIVIDLENGASRSDKENIAEKVNEKLRSMDDIEANYLLDFDDQMIANIVMTKEEQITKKQNTVTEEILKSVRELEKTEPIRAVERALDGVSGYPIQVDVHGEDFSKLNIITNDLEKDIESIEGIVGVTNTGSDVSEVQTVQLEDKEINNSEISELQIKQAVDEFLLQETIGSVEWDDEELSIHASWDDGKQTRDSLLQTKIPTENGEQNLSSLITFKEESIPKEITHKNGERYISIFADVEDKDLGAANKEIQEVIERHEVSSDYSISLGGDLEEQNELMNDLLFVLGIALFLVYVVMAVQFNHFGQPLIVMSIIPVTIVGVIIGLFISQAELNAMSGMGLIILVGIVLNNAILIIDRTNQLRRDGIPVIDALLQAGENRIRPIFMTTLTTIGGMIPLALATGMAADYQAPLAIVIISGLLFSTFITLLLIPAIYRVVSK